MDEATKKMHDALVEDEISRGYRVKTVPDRVKGLLEYASRDYPAITVWTTIRLERLTPRGKSLVSEATLQRFTEDFQSKNFLTHDELRKIALERGVWTEAEEQRIKELHERTTDEMQALYLEGFDKKQQWMEQLALLSTRYLTEASNALESDDQKKELSDVFDRWINYHVEKQSEYNEKFGPDYKPSVDFFWLMDRAPTDEMAEALDEVDGHKTKLQRLADVFQKRQELEQLTDKRAKVFSASIESRRDRTAELAQVYYGSRVVEESGKALCRLTPTFDDMWDLPDGVIEWLLTEAYFFYEGIPDATREYFEAWGFLRAERGSGSLPASDESPVPQNSKSDSPTAETPAKSSESNLDSNLMTTTSP